MLFRKLEKEKVRNVLRILLGLTQQLEQLKEDEKERKMDVELKGVRTMVIIKTIKLIITIRTTLITVFAVAVAVVVAVVVIKILVTVPITMTMMIIEKRVGMTVS